MFLLVEKIPEMGGRVGSDLFGQKFIGQESMCLTKNMFPGITLTW
jgi:hypothetical protein